MNILYLGIVLSYFGIILLIGTFLRGAAKTSESYLIAGRSMGIVLCTATIAGEWLGGMSTIGTSELAMTSGFFPMWYNVSTAVGMMIFGFTIASIYRRNQVTTVGEMLEKLYNRRTRSIASICFVAAFVILAYLQLQAIGSVMSEMLGIQFWIGVTVAGILVTAYVIRGGIESIGATNLIHVGLMYATLLTAYIVALVKIGGYEGLFLELGKVSDPETVARFRNPFSAGLAPIAAWLLGGILSGFASQASIQPVFAAKNINVAKWSAILSGLIIAPLGVIVATLGMVRRTNFFGSDEITSFRASAAVAVLFCIYWVRNNVAIPTPKAVITALISSTAASILFVIFEPQITALLGFTVDKVYAALFFALASILIVTPLIRGFILYPF